MGYNWFQGGASGSSTGQIHSKLRLIQFSGINSLLPGSAKGPGQEQDGNSQCEGGEPDWDYKELELELTGDLILEIVAKCGRLSTTQVLSLTRLPARPLAILDHIVIGI